MLNPIFVSNESIKVNTLIHTIDWALMVLKYIKCNFEYRSLKCISHMYLLQKTFEKFNSNYFYQISFFNHFEFFTAYP